MKFKIIFSIILIINFSFYGVSAQNSSVFDLVETDDQKNAANLQK